MSISTVVQSSIAAAGAAFIGLGTFSSDPASAITLNFQGNVTDYAAEVLLDGTPFEGVAVDTPFEGSVTIDDDARLESLFNSFDESTPIPSDAIGFVPTGLFSLNIGGIDLIETGVTLGTAGTSVKGPLFGVGGRGVSLSSSTFYLFVGSGDFSVKPSECLKGRVCKGFLLRNDVYNANIVGIGGFFNVTASNPQSVPEPTVAIGFGVVSAFLLVRKRKGSDSKLS